ncbi:hypothetical protein [Nocardia suismassiliense]|uniref:hypothetical protein n=1 Tax=Nocardia suismassiliense TaxID=2077092 RepID=UPI001F1ED481|nr:hypothetical protein [Nocardia suismassiliense]
MVVRPFSPTTLSPGLPCAAFGFDESSDSVFDLPDFDFDESSDSAFDLPDFDFDEPSDSVFDFDFEDELSESSLAGFLFGALGSLVHLPSSETT